MRHGKGFGRRASKYGKYGVSAPGDRTFLGRTYASKLECERARQLEQYYQAQEIELWLPQPKFTLGIPEMTYRGDFLVVARGDFWNNTVLTAVGDPVVRAPNTWRVWWVEDVKGVETPAFKKTVQLWRRYGPGPLVVLKSSKYGWSRQFVLPRRKGWWYD